MRPVQVLADTARHHLVLVGVTRSARRDRDLQASAGDVVMAADAAPIHPGKVAVWHRQALTGGRHVVKGGVALATLSLIPGGLIPQVTE